MTSTVNESLLPLSEKDLVENKSTHGEVIACAILIILIIGGIALADYGSYEYMRATVHNLNQTAMITGGFISMIIGMVGLFIGCQKNIEVAGSKRQKDSSPDNENDNTLESPPSNPEEPLQENFASLNTGNGQDHSNNIPEERVEKPEAPPNTNILKPENPVINVTQTPPILSTFTEEEIVQTIEAMDLLNIRTEIELCPPNEQFPYAHYLNCFNISKEGKQDHTVKVKYTKYDENSSQLTFQYREKEYTKKVQLPEFRLRPNVVPLFSNPNDEASIHLYTTAIDEIGPYAIVDPFGKWNSDLKGWARGSSYMLESEYTKFIDAKYGDANIFLAGSCLKIEDSGSIYVRSFSVPDLKSVKWVDETKTKIRFVREAKCPDMYQASLKDNPILTEKLSQGELIWEVPLNAKNCHFEKINEKEVRIYYS